MNSAELRVTELRQNYGGVTVLNGVDFSIPSGGLSGMIGPNGAGKSTLFSVISGFQRCAGGHIVFNGRDVTGASAISRVRLGMARTFQVPREFGSLTVRENMMAASPRQSGENLSHIFYRRGRIREEERTIAKEADAWLDFLKLAHMADSMASNLSGGQRKLLELGRALMVRPKMILLDEPFAGVNPVLMNEISQMIRVLAGQGIGFLIVEHNLTALSNLVETLLVLDRGRLLARGEPKAVLEDEAVREAYMGGSV